MTRRLRRTVSDAIPVARTRIVRLRERRSETPLRDLERSIVRRMIARNTAYAGLSALPAIVVVFGGPWLAVGVVAVLVATLIETFLSIREHMVLVVQMLWLRGFRGDDELLAELALVVAFSGGRTAPGNVASRLSLGGLAGEALEEMGETAIEIIAMELGKRLALRLSVRGMLRVVPVAGILIGSAISFVQSRILAARVLRIVPLAESRAIPTSSPG